MERVGKRERKRDIKRQSQRNRNMVGDEREKGVERWRKGKRKIV